MIFVRTLGTALIDVRGTRVDPKSARKFSLLLHLAAERGRRVPRATLYEMVFADKTEKKAQHSLRELAYQLRLAGVPIESHPDGMELPAEYVRTDYDGLLQGERPTRALLDSASNG